MSDIPQAPPPPPGFQPGTNPKAAAKAAKAYAKATRPWYRKKRWWLVGAIVLIVVIAAAASSGGGGKDKGPTVVSDKGGTTKGDGSKPAAQGGGSQADDASGTQGNPAKVGETLELAGTQYKILSAKTESSVGGSFGSKASGVYIDVSLQIENKKDSTKTFDDANTAFIAKDGTSYDTSEDEIYLDDALVLKQMQPNLPTKGELLFDVPPNVVKTGVLRISDLWGGGDAYFALGLK